MPEFVLQQKPEVAPRTCFFCGAFEGPFVNTCTLDQTGRVILMCSPQTDGPRETGCAGAIVQAIGGLTPAGARRLKTERDDAEAARAELEHRLERAKTDLAGVLA